MNLDEIIEQIAASTDAELDYTTLFSNLEYLYYEPLDLNTATETDFARIVFLTEYQIYSLVKYRQKFGKYTTIYELQYVDGIDPLTLKYLLPFVDIGDGDQKKKVSVGNMFSYGRNSIMGRYQRLFQEKAGYLPIADSILSINPDKSRYLGSPDKLYVRYDYRYKDKLYYGITAEKDDGEQFFKGAQKYGFDFYSGHFQINDLGVFKKIIVGDYIAQFGQGLTMWSGMSFGKTSGATNVIKKARGVNKYSSVNESAFMRGQAATLGFGDFEFTEFVSYKSLDGSVSTLSDSTFADQEHYISSFLESGYHRTPSEIAKRKTIKEFVSGG
ncbi:MAG: helix-hairpin-helix domain-containing protein, partial [Bacteroidales bacterium]|nr:helix-hairpin-helix domain-containing protein [Bacteroidales bacterium]